MTFRQLLATISRCFKEAFTILKGDESLSNLYLSLYQAHSEWDEEAGRLCALLREKDANLSSALDTIESLRQEVYELESYNALLLKHSGG